MMENFSKDILFCLGRNLDVTSLIHFCQTNKAIYNRLYDKDEIWRHKLSTINHKFDTDRRGFRKTFILLYQLMRLKKEISFPGTITQLHFTKRLDLTKDKIKVRVIDLLILHNLEYIFTTIKRFKKLRESPLMMQKLQQGKLIVRTKR